MVIKGETPIFQEQVQFFNSGRNVPRQRSFNFSKTGATNLKKRHFQLFNSRRLAPEFRQQRFQFSQKPSLRIAKPGVSMFQKPVPHVSKSGTFKLKTCTYFHTYNIGRKWRHIRSMCRMIIWYVFLGSLGPREHV